MRSYLSLFAVLLTVSAMQAQQLPVMNHYIYNPYLYNPARTGQNERGSVNINFKKQWVDLPHSPITGSLSAEAPLPFENMGLGGMIYSDRMHIINKLGGMLTYAYHVPFSKDFPHRLSGGMSLGFINQRFDFPEATVANPLDNQILPNEANATAFDFSIGLDYQWKSLHVGFSMLQGLNNQMRFLTNLQGDVTYINTRHFMAMSSYRFEFGEGNKQFYVEPHFMLRMIQGLPVQAEFNALVGWKNLLWGGLGYRSSNNETVTSAMMATFGIDLQKNLFLAYTFEFAVDGKLNASLGSQHEVMLAYRFGKDEKRIKRDANLDEQLTQMRAEQNRLRLEQEEKDKEQAEALEGLRKKNEEMEKRMDEEAAKNKAMQDAINEQNALMKAQQEQMTKQGQDIEELRKKIAERPMQFKKVGDVLFGNASSTLDAKAKVALDEIAKFYAASSKKPMTIYLYGHASKSGNAQQNYELSLRRSSAVKSYLMQKGIDGAKIIMLPAGMKMADNAGDAQGDRRVDVFFGEE